jgi:L-aspartate oxidase
MKKTHDVLIIGSGAAGLTCALRLAEQGIKSAVLCKGPLHEGSTWYAQGGIAAVLDSKDTLKSHVADTLDSGAGLCDEAAVEFTVSHAKTAIQWLIDQGVYFTKETTRYGNERYHLHQEGGHSHRRIIHAEDATGKSVENTLVSLARANKYIKLFEHHIAVDLITQNGRCVGAYAYGEKAKKVKAFGAKATLIACGGASRVYTYTTNPSVSSGDGIAVAYRAGCRVANMEFNQFHPTCLYHPDAGSFLLSEAMRGEGAHLLLPDGTRFMPKFDERAELAPRDIVARAIDYEMKRLGLDCVYLDISHKDKAFIQEHFPSIYKRCKKFGFDLAKTPIPVVPAAHYTCGGVMVNDKAQTDLPGLYAAGEVTYTGLHGANRMASNSILECLVYAEAAANDIAATVETVKAPADIKPWDESKVTDAQESILITQNWDEIRRFMWNYVGIVRSDKRLARAGHRIALLKQEIADYYGDFKVSKDLLELRNLILVAELIVTSAQTRKESRGLHFTLDYKKPNKAFLAPTVL